MSKHFYHGSTTFIPAIKPNTPVTQYKEDAIYIAVPWLLGLSHEEVLKNIELTKDNCIYVFKITTNDVRKPDGGWCWQTTGWSKAELVEYYPSWWKLMGLSFENKIKSLYEKLENFKTI